VLFLIFGHEQKPIAMLPATVEQSSNQTKNNKNNTLLIIGGNIVCNLLKST
jgi:hypothetical protein